MAWEDEIQKAGSMVGDIGGVINQGLSIFSRARDTLYPTYSQSPPAPEPVAARPIVATASPLSGLAAKPGLIVAILVVGYLLFAKK